MMAVKYWTKSCSSLEMKKQLKGPFCYEFQRAKVKAKGRPPIMSWVRILPGAGLFLFFLFTWCQVLDHV